jgi:uncharacterized protein GlcG (DUF336 family)
MPNVQHAAQLAIARQFKALKFRTPYEAIKELWKSKPETFIVKPSHHMPGLNN